MREDTCGHDLDFNSDLCEIGENELAAAKLHTPGANTGFELENKSWDLFLSSINV